MPASLLVALGNQRAQSLSAPGYTGTSQSRLLYISDRNSIGPFLVDTSADVSIVPASSADRRGCTYTPSLQTANETLIKTYGQRSLTLNFGLRCSSQFTFWIEDMHHVMIGVDFLRHLNLLVHMAHQRL